MHGDGFSLPRFTHLFPSEVILDPGSRLSLKCEATGSPLPQITWTLDNSPILESHSRIRIGDYVTNNGFVNSFVNLTSVRVEDGGLYSCSGKTTSDKTLHHQYLSDPPTPPLFMTCIS